MFSLIQKFGLLKILDLFNTSISEYSQIVNLVLLLLFFPEGQVLFEELND